MWQIRFSYGIGKFISVNLQG